MDRIQYHPDEDDTILLPRKMLIGMKASPRLNKFSDGRGYSVIHGHLCYMGW